MHTHSLFGLLAVTCTSTTLSAYILSADDTYSGNSFFDKFNFYNNGDPNRGFVQYQDQNTAYNSKLISINQAQQAYIGVDSSNVLDLNSGRGRSSIRLETKKTYQYGLFVLDLAHMPSNTCGTWPAFWTTNDQDWPRWGEIDILENIHENNNTLEALHTSPGCTVAGNQKGNQMSGRQTTYNCDGAATSSPYGPQGSGQGCSADNTNPNNYGTSFNDNGGGIYAMEWNNQAISIWHFGRNNIPNDLSAGAPNPTGWGQPVFTTAQGSCNIDDHFKDQKVIIDNAFCGNWAGQDALWQQTSCYRSNPSQYPTCASYVAANPGAYKESYWLINSLRVYQNRLSTLETLNLTQTKDQSSSGPLVNEPEILEAESKIYQMQGPATSAVSSPTYSSIDTPKIFEESVAESDTSSTAITSSSTVNVALPNIQVPTVTATLSAILFDRDEAGPSTASSTQHPLSYTPMRSAVATSPAQFNTSTASPNSTFRKIESKTYSNSGKPLSSTPTNLHATETRTATPSTNTVDPRLVTSLGGRSFQIGSSLSRTLFIALSILGMMLPINLL
ncbi:BgTH12-03928 [Blumeria graminis f. sp. triticale]|uniref:Bgt-4507 n=2 Tax=Blumeria graminis TaxID=34373 RepID=A0A9X9PR69_BLUGR|nr:BgTH12-03928 [Blumeria graminis f. sp. triticale]VCU39990.1 Bgt-4507 [Blumeria graminis f. sp. tritici]